LTFSNIPKIDVMEFRISATYGIRTTSYREILYFNDDDEKGDRVFISNGKKTNTRRDREREERECECSSAPPRSVGLHPNNRLLTLPTNIRLGGQYFPRTNTLAYYENP